MFTPSHSDLSPSSSSSSSADLQPPLNNNSNRSSQDIQGLPSLHSLLAPTTSNHIFMHHQSSPHIHLPHPSPLLPATTTTTTTTAHRHSDLSTSPYFDNPLRVTASRHQPVVETDHHSNALSLNPTSLLLPRSSQPKRKDKRGARPRYIPCIGCDATFDRPSAMRTHMLSHTGEKPHECPKCHRRFSVVSNMKRHQKSCGLGKRRKADQHSQDGDSPPLPEDEEGEEDDHLRYATTTTQQQQQPLPHSFHPTSIPESSNASTHGYNDSSPEASVFSPDDPRIYSSNFHRSSSPVSYEPRIIYDDGTLPPLRSSSSTHSDLNRVYHTTSIDSPSPSYPPLSGAVSSGSYTPTTAASFHPYLDTRPFQSSRVTASPHRVTLTLDTDLKPPRKKRQPARSPQALWIPDSLRHLRNAEQLSSNGPFKYLPKTETLITAPLKPVRPRGKPIPLGGGHHINRSFSGPGESSTSTVPSYHYGGYSAFENDDESWEERDSYDQSVPRQPYHANQWRERLPGPDILPADELMKEARRARRWLLA